MDYIAENLVTLPSPIPVGLCETVSAAGHQLECHNGQFYADSAAAVQGIINGYTAANALSWAQSKRLADLADMRWEKETGGTIWNGVTLATDDRSKIMIEGARSSAEANSAYTVNWKVVPGQFSTLTAAQIISASDQVRAHVQGCFDNEKALSEQIMGLADPGQVLSFDISGGWPT